MSFHGIDLYIEYLNIEYLKFRADLNFGVIGAIGTLVTKRDFILFG